MEYELEIVPKLSNGTVFIDLQRPLKLNFKVSTTDTVMHAASLRQLSFLFS